MKYSSAKQTTSLANNLVLEQSFIDLTERQYMLPENAKNRAPGDNIVQRSKAGITKMRKNLKAERKIKKQNMSANDRNDIAALCALIMAGKKKSD